MKPQASEEAVQTPTSFVACVPWPVSHSSRMKDVMDACSQLWPHGASGPSWQGLGPPSHPWADLRPHHITYWA